jgi:hypothetical protein
MLKKVAVFQQPVDLFICEFAETRPLLANALEVDWFMIQ